MDKVPNRLINESSPYLRQHAYNPVDWFPWGEEAFAESLRRDCPIFLSIGYATCHWCHVMEEESFEDADIAKYLNDHFVSIKVDREERPDVDSLYMRVVQAMNGSGGWPMSVWLKPNRQPFFAGTYFPARDGDRGSRMGFFSLLKQIQAVYKNNLQGVEEQAANLMDFLRKTKAEQKSQSFSLTADLLHKAFNYYQKNYDNTFGGMRGAPKFPSSLSLPFLFSYARSFDSQTAREMGLHTLTMMAKGGIYDQIGGGFHRYSTDATWLVPHFEKMLYDNALLISAYAYAYQLEPREHFKHVVYETLQFIQRDMSFATDAGIGFYSAYDADSVTPDQKKEEGYYYSWTRNEMNSVLGEKISPDIEKFFGLTDEGNFEGRNVLYMAEPFPKDPESLKLLLNSKEKLLAARDRRPRPILDDKTLTGWNALMISAYARAGFFMNDGQFLTKAIKAARFLTATLSKEEALYRCYKDGKIKQLAFADDYAFLIRACLDVFEFAGEMTFLKYAIRLNEVFMETFWDEKGGGFFLTGNHHEALLINEKPSYDGAEPSANSVAAMNFLRLYVLTADTQFLHRAEKLFGAFSQTLNQYPMSVAEMLTAVDFYLAKRELAVVIKSADAYENQKIVDVLRSKYSLHRTLVMINEKDATEAETFLPVVRGKRLLDGKTTVYLCEDENFTCKKPINNAKELVEALRLS